MFSHIICLCAGSFICIMITDKWSLCRTVWTYCILACLKWCMISHASLCTVECASFLWSYCDLSCSTWLVYHSVLSHGQLASHFADWSKCCHVTFIMGMCCKKMMMIGWRNAWSMKLRVQDQGEDQRGPGKRLFERTVRHISWIKRMPWTVTNGERWLRKYVVQHGCEWVNVSSGTGLPGLSRTNGR